MKVSICQYCKEEGAICNVLPLLKRSNLMIDKTGKIKLFFAPVGFYPCNPIGAIYGVTTSDKARIKFSNELFKRNNIDNILMRFKRACITSLYEGNMRDNFIEYLSLALRIFDIHYFKEIKEAIDNNEFFDSPRWYDKSPLLLSQAIKCACLLNTEKGYSSSMNNVPLGQTKYKFQYDCLCLTFKKIESINSLRFAFFQGSLSIFKKYINFFHVSGFKFNQQQVVVFDKVNKKYRILDIKDIRNDRTLCYISSIPHASNQGMGNLTFGANEKCKIACQERRKFIFRLLAEDDLSRNNDEVSKEILYKYKKQFCPSEDSAKRISTLVTQTLIARRILSTVL